MAGIGSRGGQNPLELQGGEDIREAAVAQVLLQSGVEDLVPRCEDDSADVQFARLLLSVCSQSHWPGRRLSRYDNRSRCRTRGSVWPRRSLAPACSRCGPRRKSARGSAGSRAGTGIWRCISTPAVSTAYCGVIRTFQLAPRAQVLAIEPAVDGVGGLLAREHRRDHYVGTGHAISPSKHAGQFGRQRQRIGMERSPFRGRQTQAALRVRSRRGPGQSWPRLRRKG